MVTEGKPYFLSRPRRFGKSPLVSTPEACFQGKRDLFDGTGGGARLVVADLETGWASHPVIHLDLSGNEYRDLQGLKAGLNINLLELERV